MGRKYYRMNRKGAWLSTGMCSECGAIVGESKQHNEWHDTQLAHVGRLRSLEEKGWTQEDVQVAMRELPPMEGAVETGPT